MTDAEREAQAFLASILQDNPLPEAPNKEDKGAEEQEGVYRIDSLAAKSLHCIALVRDGKIMPYISLEEVPEPRTPGEKMIYMAFIVKAIVEGMITAIQLSEERRHPSDDEGGCHA